MEKYTFIFEYKKGTYISQYMSDSLYAAIETWCDCLNQPILSDVEKKQLRSDIDKDYEKPVSIDGVENVWCMFLRIGKQSHILNIILTV